MPDLTETQGKSVAAQAPFTFVTLQEDELIILLPQSIIQLKLQMSFLQILMIVHRIPVETMELVLMALLILVVNARTDGKARPAR